MVRFGINISETLDERLNVASEEIGASKSAIAAIAIREWLDRLDASRSKREV